MFLEANSRGRWRDSQQLVSKSIFTTLVTGTHRKLGSGTHGGNSQAIAEKPPSRSKYS